MKENLPKLILTDIDGVWTDGGMYYDQTGNEWKRFSTYDGAGVTIAHDNGAKVGIITGEDTNIVAHRANKLHVDFVYQGVKDKVKIAKDCCNQLGISFDEVAYIGDDIADIPLLKIVEYSAAPANAMSSVKCIVNYVTSCSGGQGAFREFVEWIYAR